MRGPDGRGPGNGELEEAGGGGLPGAWLGGESSEPGPALRSRHCGSAPRFASPRAGLPWESLRPHDSRCVPNTSTTSPPFGCTDLPLRLINALKGKISSPPPSKSEKWRLKVRDQEPKRERSGEKSGRKKKKKKNPSAFCSGGSSWAGTPSRAGVEKGPFVQQGG